MLTWDEINNIENRTQYEIEYYNRKVYDKMTPVVDKIYTAFIFYAWSKGYYDVANKGANECWTLFYKSTKDTEIGRWIKEMLTAPCATDLKKYFNAKLKQQNKFIGRKTL